MLTRFLARGPEFYRTKWGVALDILLGTTLFTLEGFALLAFTPLLASTPAGKVLLTIVILEIGLIIYLRRTWLLAGLILAVALILVMAILTAMTMMRAF
jgi:hypothetical protein